MRFINCEQVLKTNLYEDDICSTSQKICTYNYGGITLLPNFHRLLGTLALPKICEYSCRQHVLSLSPKRDEPITKLTLNDCTSHRH